MNRYVVKYAERGISCPEGPIQEFEVDAATPAEAVDACRAANGGAIIKSVHGTPKPVEFTC